MKKNYAFIFARGGSKGLKNKNIKMFKGKHLISYSINLAKQNKNIKKVFVSSDDKKIIKISKYYGAETILRPKSLSRDNSSELKAWKHAIQYLDKKGETFDNFICLPCTSPLRKLKDINNGLKKLKKKNDLVVGISKSHKNPRFNMVKKNNNKIKLLIPGKIHSNRQNFEEVFNLTTIIYACHYSLIKKLKKNIWESNIKYIYIPQHRAIDIDSKLDFDIAEYLYKNYN
jgi:N,N'-diacetyl-8-epilegionaminate cytidylyltransferase